MNLSLLVASCRILPPTLGLAPHLEQPVSKHRRAVFSLFPLTKRLLARVEWGSLRRVVEVVLEEILKCLLGRSSFDTKGQAGTGLGEEGEE